MKWVKVRTLDTFFIHLVILLFCHVDEIKDGIEHRVEKVREAQAEDKEVGDMSHLVISWNKNSSSYKCDKDHICSFMCKYKFKI